MSVCLAARHTSAHPNTPQCSQFTPVYVVMGRYTDSDGLKLTESC